MARRCIEDQDQHVHMCWQASWQVHNHFPESRNVSIRKQEVHHDHSQYRQTIPFIVRKGPKLDPPKPQTHDWKRQG